MWPDWPFMRRRRDDGASVDQWIKHIARSLACALGGLLFRICGPACIRTFGGDTWMVYSGSPGLELGVAGMGLSFVPAHLYPVFRAEGRHPFHRDHRWYGVRGAT